MSKYPTHDNYIEIMLNDWMTEKEYIDFMHAIGGDNFSIFKMIKHKREQRQIREDGEVIRSWYQS